MTTITTLQTQDSALREQYSQNPEAVHVARINALLERVRQTSQSTSGIQERDALLQIMKFWAPIVEQKTGEHPGTKLSPYDPTVEVDEEEMTDEEVAEEETAVPAPVAEANEIEPTVTYIPGEPEGDAPQTLAQLFMTMPNWAKVVILVLIALILATLIYWIVSPKSEQAVADVPGTETAVVAAITASAQPTATTTATATPRIYIQSETAVAESAPPVGTPTPIIYIVQTGDTLNSISRKYGIPVQDIAVLNNIYNANSIAVGQELLIPTPGPGTSVASTPVVGEATPAAPQTETDSVTAPQVEPAPSTVSELVIRGSDTVELRIAAGADYQAITSLPQGTFATIIAKTPDGIWYLIQLEDGYTRGWVPAEFSALLYPADPNTIPTTPVP